ncbi:MAG: 3-hydroxyacyl-CoA dehydrogenase family protein [Clostridiales bacterium]|nr:3-hydroxyacyl-CoA dehydrogenase family protein [Clostridiales bacterium]
MKQKIAVLGAGTMGHGIAASFAMGGHNINLYGRNETSVQRGIDQIREDLDVMVSLDFISCEEEEKALANISPCTDLQSAVSDRDYVIEVLPENLQLKLEFLQKLDEWCPPHTILASNTSSLKLAEMSKALSPERVKRFVINHWFNPAHIVPLVELSDYGNNDQDVLDEVCRMHLDLGKQPVFVKKDVPGMLANRLQQAVLREVFSLVEKGVATAEDLDRTMQYGPGFRYPLAGPVRIVDYGGSDVWCVEAGNLLPDMDDSHEPNPLFRERLETGELGLKTGKGFYDFRGQDATEIRAKFNEDMIRQLKLSKEFFMK